MAAQFINFHVVSGGSTGHGHQHSPRLHHGQWTPTRLSMAASLRTSAGFQEGAETTDIQRALVVTRIKDINMASGSSTGHRHQDDLHWQDRSWKPTCPREVAGHRHPHRSRTLTRPRAVAQITDTNMASGGKESRGSSKEAQSSK